MPNPVRYTTISIDTAMRDKFTRLKRNVGIALERDRDITYSELIELLSTNETAVIAAIVGNPGAK